MDNNRVPDKERLWDVETHRGLKPNERSVAENNSVGLKSRAFWLKDRVTVSSLLAFRVQLFFLIVNEAGSTLPHRVVRERLSSFGDWRLNPESYWLMLSMCSPIPRHLFAFYSETRSHCVSQAGLQLVILPPQPPKQLGLDA